MEKKVKRECRSYKNKETVKPREKENARPNVLKASKPQPGQSGTFTYQKESQKKGNKAP